MMSDFYRELFPSRLSPQKCSLSEFATTRNGFRMATSVGGVLTGRGADFIIIDDPLKPDEALSDVQRQTVNDWYDHSLCTRLNNKSTGCIIVVMQRLHEDDLVGHVLQLGGWTVLRFPAIAEEDESYQFDTPFGRRCHRRLAGEALHPERESLEVLATLRRSLGEYNFAGQYQQSPAPAGGGIVKKEWFKTYTNQDLPTAFDLVFQSWDTANKATELGDFSVCTTWGRNGQRLYLLNVFRKRLDYPELKRAVRGQAASFNAKIILIEDMASGTQLSQDLIADGVHGIKRYRPKLEKEMRMHTASSTIENGFVYLPESAHWLAEYQHELSVFPKGKYDDQVDSTSQALDWANKPKRRCGLVELWKEQAEQQQREAEQPVRYNFKNLPD
jgi:predicted phage terminase large subunit-like protein